MDEETARAAKRANDRPTILSHTQVEELLDLLEKRLEMRKSFAQDVAGSVSNRPFDLGAGNGLRAAIERQEANTRVSSTLEEIATRIRMVQNRAAGIAGELHDHADRVHGPVPEHDEEGIARPQPDGQISAIFGALSDLDRTMSVLHEQAARNTAIA